MAAYDQEQRDFSDIQMKLWIGSSLMRGMWDRPDPIAYGLNPYAGVGAKTAAKRAAEQAAQRKAFAASSLGKTRFAGQRTLFGHLRMRPEAFSREFTKRFKGLGIRGPKAEAFYNKIVFGQASFFGRRSQEALRRLAAKKVITSSGRVKAAGYFSKKMWDLAGAKGRALRPALVRAGVGKIAGVTSKILRAGWGATLLYEVAESSVKMLRQGARRSAALEWGSGFEITQGLYTERQRAVQAITSSRMSSRSAIGGEAAMMHR